MSEGVRELKEKAQSLLARRQHTKALAVFERVIALAPEDVFALKKMAEILDALGEKPRAAESFVRLSTVLDRCGRRLQAVSCCKLALSCVPDDAAAKSLLERLYQQSDSSSAAFMFDQQALARRPVAPPHQGGGAAPAVAETEGLPFAEADCVGELPPPTARHVEIFVSALAELCASFSGTVLEAQTQSLTDSIAANTDFLWMIQFSGAVDHGVIVSAQRAFVVSLTSRVLDVDGAAVTDAMAAKLSNKLIGMYADDVKRAFAAIGAVVHSGPPLPVAGSSASFQMTGTPAVHVPLSSEIGWVNVTVTGGL